MLQKTMLIGDPSDYQGEASIKESVMIPVEEDTGVAVLKICISLIPTESSPKYVAWLCR